MKKPIFAVCDLEAAYAYHLMERSNGKPGMPFEMQAFTNIKSLGLYASQHEIWILLISAKAMCPEVKDMNIRKIMILSEGEIIEELAEYPAVYKYQSSDSLIAEVMGYYSRQEAAADPLAVMKKDVELIGVYSPVRRTLKTSFALTLGQVLAQGRTVLYINLEAYSGMEELLRKEFDTDITDLMYFVKEGNGNVIYKLNSIVQTFHNLDFLPPALSPYDIRDVTQKDWEGLLDEVVQFSTYNTIILDLDEHVEGAFELLRRCGRIYMPVREDHVSASKLAQYEKLLRRWDYEDIMEKTRKLKLPFHSSFGERGDYLEQLLWGELGDYVRKLVKEERSGPYGK